MKKIAVMFGLFVLAAIIVVPMTGSAHYSPSNSSVERNISVLIADGSPRPPFPPIIVADGSPVHHFPRRRLLTAVLRRRLFYLPNRHNAEALN